MNKAPGQPLGGLFFGGHPFIVISDNYLSATVVSYQKKDCGSHFVSYFSNGILSISTSSRGGCGRDGLPSLRFFLSPLSGAPLGGLPVPPYTRYLLIPIPKDHLPASRWYFNFRDRALIVHF